MVPCYFLSIQQSVLGDSKFPGGDSREEFPGKFPGNSREIPSREIPVAREFPGAREFPVAREIPVVREIPGRDIFQASREGGFGNFPLNITDS